MPTGKKLPEIRPAPLNQDGKGAGLGGDRPPLAQAPGGAGPTELTGESAAPEPVARRYTKSRTVKA
jgi:hypothetical protein